MPRGIKIGFQTLWTLFKPVTPMRSQQEQTTNIHQTVHNGHKIKSGLTFFLVREASLTGSWDKIYKMAPKNGTIFQHWTSPGFTLHPLFLFLTENSRTTSCLTSPYHPCWLVQEWRGTGPMPEAFGTVHETCITRGCREHVICVLRNIWPWQKS